MEINHAGIPAFSESKVMSGKSSWWVDRAREPSTYQGLSMLAGVLGSLFLGNPETGMMALEAGLAVAACIGVGKREAVPGRDFPANGASGEVEAP
jgi:hypothetical protein